MPEGQESVVWLNGALLAARLARIDPSDRGLTLGDGIFETIRVRNAVPRQVRHHLARLRRGAEQLGIQIPLTDADISAAFNQTLAANGLVDAVLRLTLTRGTGPRGVAPPANVTPTMLITAAAWVEPPSQITAMICQTTRRNEFSPLSGLKSLNYLDNILACREARQRGADDAILLNTQGNAAEATAANLFVLKGGKWFTPAVRDGALPGIFRARALAVDAAREATLGPGDLLAAEALCFGNALAVRSVSRLDGNEIRANPAEVAELRAILETED
jgi:branched-chain amino acid aminotransferase